MNPPAGEDDEPGDGRAASYLGSEPLDPALADRFPFVVTVPGWPDLDARQRAAVVLGREDGPREAATEPLADLVARCAEQVPVVAAGLEEFGPAYVLALADQLGQASLPPSPRRCRMLFRSFAAVHAARLALGETPCLLEDSAWLALRTGLPQSAETSPPSLATLLGLHRQAWEIASTAQDSPWRKVLEEPDPLRRVKLAHALGLPDADVARLVTRALAEQPHDAARVAAATTMFLAFQSTRDLTPAAWEPLARLSARVLSPRWVSSTVSPGADARVVARDQPLPLRPRRGRAVHAAAAQLPAGRFPGPVARGGLARRRGAVRRAPGGVRQRARRGPMRPDPAVAPPLLHNMSFRPSTEVRGYLAPLGPMVVRFELARVDPGLVAQVKARGLAEALVEEAERAWGEAPFTGAALVFQWTSDAASPPDGQAAVGVRIATDACTVLNVLGRARGPLLLPRWPLSREPEHLLRALASDDPRLVRLAERTGWEARP